MTAPITTRDLQVGDVTFHLSESGPVDAPVILWLHGSGPGVTAMSNWEWMIGELGDEYRNLAPDVIGFGDSTHPDPPPQGIGAFNALRVDTLVALLDTLGIQTVTMVGNSMGGMLAVALTQQAPERVERLVLMGTGGAPGVGLLPGLVKLVTFYDDPSTEAMTELLTLFVHDPSSFGDELGDIAAARIPRATRPEVERSHRATFAPVPDGPPPLRADEDSLAQITQPTLVVHGDDDKIVDLANGQYFAKHIPGARFELFADTGHWLQIEKGPEFAALLREFLAEH